MNVEIRRGQGIEGLVKHVLVDEVGSLDHKDTGHLMMLDRYREYLDGPYGSSYFVRGLGEMEVLTPDEISAFTRLTMLFDDHKGFGYKTGYFISRLIYDSHNAGHSEFTIHPPSEIDILCSYLSGVERPLTITVIGDVGDHFGTGCEGVDLTVTGDTGSACGYASKGSEYRLNGDVGNAAGMSSENSKFTITGDAKYYLGSQSIGASFYVEGKIEMGCGRGSENSTYETPNKKTLNKLRKDVPEGNRVIFMKGEKEKKIRRPLRYIRAHIGKLRNSKMHT